MRSAFETLADHADSPNPGSSKTTISVASVRTLTTYRRTDLSGANFLEADLGTTYAIRPNGQG